MKDPTSTRDVGPRVGTPLWLYFASTTVAGCVLLVVSLIWLGADRLQVFATEPLVWVLLCMVIIGELRPIAAQRPTGGNAPTSLPFSFALVIYHGLPIAGLVQAVGSLLAGVTRGQEPHRIAFNIAQYTLSFGVADAVIQLAYPRTPLVPWVPQGSGLVMVVLAAGAYFVTNLLLVECAVAMHERIPLHRVLMKDLGYRLFVAGVLLSLAPLVVIAMAHSIWLVPLFFFPLAALYSSASLSVKREYQANHDELTGLANRKLLILRTQEALSEAQERRQCVGLLLLDLDRFKEVNDTLGHPTGDRLLQTVAYRLTHSVRPGDLVARLGGDEFAVLLPQVRDAASAREVAARLRVALAEPLRLDGMDFDLEASIGIALYPDHAPDFELLMQRADVAMYVAKEQRTGVELYAPHKDRNSAARLSLFGELRRALIENELEMFYQPIVALADERVVALEALVRWRHRRRGILPPEEFVPMVEQSYLMRSFTHEVIEQTCAQAARWWSEGITLPVAINLSARELLDPTLPESIESGLRRYRLQPKALRLEISERALVSDAEAIIPAIMSLAELGVTVALDDFGTGYFTLARLNGLPVGEVKVDGSFVRHVIDDSDSKVVVEAAVDLMNTLGLRAIAEGVENAEQVEAVRALGCYAAQGRYFTPPLDAGAVTGWLLEHGDLAISPSASSTGTSWPHSGMRPPTTPQQP
ncbi:diguanylate cyclase/phosphodiesterase [Thermobifida fusca TM51]|jgi:diguanylate cyclase (GGDEF)-like protein|uniref:Diguanylate cyclase/phosphodiesterase n=1 Tax=Thermobifida fusca TM51 TaxID=1169414 RepID=A0A9P2WRJ9_THEFU|nr:EAL domain-containing protein [Thermobifida fusca]EOR72154.1 diguanylate cyclase/phosphodiesterase [Thermobifida fusca TM51]MDD6792908.1 EAL domain-containing protein [Thermobifida fusca]